MASKDDKERELYDTLEALSGGTDVPPSQEAFSLEEILAEYGGGRERLMRSVEAQAAPILEEALAAGEAAAPPPIRGKARREGPAPAKPPAASEQAAGEAPEPARTLADELAGLQEALPQAPRPISLEEVVSGTVDAVMEEDTEAAEPLLKKRRRGLFARREMEETEELYDPPGPEPEPLREEDTIGPEPELGEAAEDLRRQVRARGRGIAAAFCVALLSALPLVLEARGVAIPWWTEDARLQTLVLLGCLAVSCLLGRHVFSKAVQMLGRRRCTSELMICLSALAAAGDCVARLLLPERSAAAPYAAVACMAMAFAMWGGARESRGLYQTFRTASVDDEPPYLVTETGQGACKQRGTARGFYTTASRPDGAAVLSAALGPVVLVATVVFAGLSSLGQGRGDDFLLNWSALLCAGGTFALPLCWGLPFDRLARHLQKAGCAVAGWAGAEAVSRRRSMIVTDTDLFPPGTIQLNGVKVYGTEMAQAVSYAATLARCAGCGLHRLFDGLLRSELGRYEEADDFSFYEEGGYSANIHGETVLLGTASFMRKMDVRLPAGINLRTGVFLAVDRQIAAVFAVKYNPSENVDFALRMMRRSRIVPILAARDPNITPALIKRKFHRGVKLEYPDLSTRVALSEAEEDRGMPRALLFREGLLPYAETVVGSRRLCKAVRQGTALSFFSSAAGVLLSFYLVFGGEYGLLTPLALLVYLLLWTVPVLLLSIRTGRY